MRNPEPNAAVNAAVFRTTKMRSPGASVDAVNQTPQPNSLKLAGDLRSGFPLPQSSRDFQRVPTNGDDEADADEADVLRE